MLMLINPKGATTKHGKRKKKASAKQIAARKKFAQMARERAKARKAARSAKAARSTTRRATALRQNGSRSVGGSQMAAKRKTHRKRKGVSARKHSVGRHRSHRRKGAKSRTMTIAVGKKGFGVRANPGVVGMVVQGAKDAGAIVGGKVAANVVARAIPLADTGAMGVVKRVGAAAVVGYAAQKFLSRDVARLMLAGGLTAVIENAARAVLPANIVAIGLQGDDADALGAYLAGIEEGAALGAEEALGAYPALGASDDAMGAYPDGIGESMGMMN